MTREAPATPAATTGSNRWELSGRAAPANRRRHLSPWARKTLLITHVTTSVGLLGADAAVLALVVAGWRGSEPLTVYPAAQLLGQALVLPLALLALATGAALGLLTPWGLLRHWWVLIKLVLTTGGTVLALFVLVPTLEAADADALAHHPPADQLGLVKDAGGASGVLIATILIAYVKPFGRLRPRRR